MIPVPGSCLMLTPYSPEFLSESLSCLRVGRGTVTRHLGLGLALLRGYRVTRRLLLHLKVHGRQVVIHVQRKNI